MTMSTVQHVLNLRYGTLLRYAHGVVMSTATDAPTLATACVLVRRAAVWPVRSTDEDEIYRVLRRRVLRRALRSRRRPWSALSRKARVEPEPVADRELLRDAGAVCRAILLLQLVDDMSIDDAEKLVTSLAPRGRDVGAAAAEARRLLNDTTPSTVDTRSDTARLRGPSIRRTRVQWLGIGVAALAVAVVAGVLLIPSTPPDDLGIDVLAGAARPGSGCELPWPARGEALSSGAPLEAPLVRRAIEFWQQETEDFGVDPGTELTPRDPPWTVTVSVLFAGRTDEDHRAVLLCQGDKLARYVEPPRVDRFWHPSLSVTTLPQLSTTSDDLIKRVPFVDLGAAWLVDPDATRVRATPAGVARTQWTDLSIDRRGVAEDVTTAATSDDTCNPSGYGVPTVVRVDLPRSPRYHKPRLSGDKSPTSVFAVHAGEQLKDHVDPWTLLPSMAWDTGTSAEHLGALDGFACGDQFTVSELDPVAYAEINELRTVASVPLPGQGTQVAFQASVGENSSDIKYRPDAEYHGGLTTTSGSYELSDLGDPEADGVAGWTTGLDGHWYYVAAGGADTARIQVTGAVSGTTTGRALVLRGPKIGKREYNGYGLPGPMLPVAVAFYDKRGGIIKAG